MADNFGGSLLTAAILTKQELRCVHRGYGTDRRWSLLGWRRQLVHQPEQVRYWSVCHVIKRGTQMGKNSFFREVRNLKIDLTAVPTGTGIHWQVVSIVLARIYSHFDRWFWIERIFAVASDIPNKHRHHHVWRSRHQTARCLHRQRQFGNDIGYFLHRRFLGHAIGESASYSAQSPFHKYEDGHATDLELVICLLYVSAFSGTSKYDQRITAWIIINAQTTSL